MTTIVIKKIKNSELRPITHIHGWINLAPLKKTAKGFICSLSLNPRLALTVEISTGTKSAICKSAINLDASTRLILRHQTERMLSVDFPLAEFKDLCRKKKSKIFLKLANAGWGRLLRSPTAWEDAVKTLCTTNASWGQTEGMCNRLCNRLGSKTRSGLSAFPLPPAIIRLGEEKLRSEIKMGYRSKYLISLAERAISGEVSWLLGAQARTEEESVLQEIKSWPGFGKYAVNHMMILLGFHNYLPIDREVTKYFTQALKKEKDISQAYEQWGKFRFTAYKLERVGRKLNWIGD